MSDPRVPGVIFWNKIELVGLFPSKILDLTSAALEADAPSSCLTSSSVLPNARALNVSEEGRSSLLGLGEEVGKENLVVLSTRDWVEGFDRGEEVATVSCDPRANSPRDELGSLVDQLVESMLTVGTALSPDNRLDVSAGTAGKRTPVS